MLEEVQKIYKHFKNLGNQLFLFFILQGMLLIIFAVIMLYEPYALVLLVAFFFFAVGIGSLWLALKIEEGVRKMDLIKKKIVRK